MEITVCMRNSLSLYNLAHRINVHPLSFMTSWQSVDFSMAVSEHVYLCRYFCLFFVWYTCKRRPKYNHKMLYVETLIYRVTLHHDFDENSDRWIRLLFHPCVESFSFNWTTFNSYLPSGCKHLGVLYICTMLSVSVNSLLSCIKVDSLFTWIVCSRVTAFEGIKNFLTFLTWLVSLDVRSRLTAYIDSVFKVDSLMDSLFKVDSLHG